MSMAVAALLGEGRMYMSYQGKHSDSRKSYIRCFGASVSIAQIWPHVLLTLEFKSSISPAEA